MNEKEMKKKIEYLKKHIPTIKNRQTRLQQLKYMHRLMKQIKIYRRWLNEGDILF